MPDPIHVLCPHCGVANRLPAARLAEAPRCGACKAPLFDGHPVALDDAAFRAHLRGDDIPLLVDFWATWCGPCRTMAPEFERAASLLEPRVRLAKVDIDAAPALAAELGIQSVPTIALFARGREVARRSGAMPARQIAAWVAEAAAQP
ncbi:MAG: thioredoxin TrxC [Alphaproteobacteria bacterium]|nr:thioredoxin TrxC [Alphaproteobacteria bacterium]